MTSEMLSYIDSLFEGYSANHNHDLRPPWAQAHPVHKLRVWLKGTRTGCREEHEDGVRGDLTKLSPLPTSNAPQYSPGLCYSCSPYSFPDYPHNLIHSHIWISIKDNSSRKANQSAFSCEGWMISPIAILDHYFHILGTLNSIALN